MIIVSAPLSTSISAKVQTYEVMCLSHLDEICLDNVGFSPLFVVQCFLR